MSGLERVSELLTSQVQLMMLETMTDGPSRGECRARLNNETSAISADLDTLARIREAAKPAEDELVELILHRTGNTPMTPRAMADVEQALAFLLRAIRGER